MSSKNKAQEKASSNYEENDSNSFIVQVDKTVSKDPLKFPKNKIFEQVPIEVSEEKFEIIDSKSYSCLNYLDNIDKTISKPLQAYPSNPAMEYIFFIFSKIFNYEGIITYLSLLFIYSFLNNHIYIFLIPLAQVLVGGILTYLLKKFVGRDRPKILAKRYFINVRDKEKTKSMPSGDCLQCAIFMTMVILYFDRNIKYFVLLLFPGVMCSRIYFNCHYLFDCIIGAVIGIFISICSHLIINKINLHF